MPRWRLDPDAAFAALREVADRSQRRLHDVGAALVEQQPRLVSGP